MAIEENGGRTKIATENEVYMTEPSLFKIFDIQVLTGNPAEALERPLTVMLSEKAAQNRRTALLASSSKDGAAW